MYFSYGLYATSAYALLVSCPLQLVTFASWRKRPSGSGNSVKLRRLSQKARILIVLGFAVGSSYMLLDNTVSLLGILSTVQKMLSYIEYLPLTVLGNLCNVFLY